MKLLITRHKNTTYKTQDKLKPRYRNLLIFFQLKKLNNLTNPGLVASYDIWPGNGAGLLSKEITKKQVIK